MKIYTARFAAARLAPAILVPVFVAIGSLAVQAAEIRNQITALREDNRETRVAEKLRVNMRTEFRLVFPNKCEKEGEFELHQLASSFNAEESFVLIPDLCLWIEVGYDENRNRVRLDLKLINALTKQFHSLSFYHIHAGEFPHLENYFPAYKDLVTLTLINADFIWNPNILIKHMLVSKLGMMEYRFSNKKKVKKHLNHYRKTGLRGFEAQNLAYEYMRYKYRNDYYSQVQNCKSYKGTIKQKIDACCPIQTEAFALIFRPNTMSVKY